MYEPVKTARLQRVIQRVPGLRRIGKNTDSEEELIPPHPLHEIKWAVPFGLNSSSGGPRHVSLKADIDESGGVTRVELLAPKSEDLLTRAADAAGAWKFTPARVNDKAVASQIILHFWFEDRP
jgi:hypothetical protein